MLLARAAFPARWQIGEAYELVETIKDVVDENPETIIEAHADAQIRI